ncbi:MAG: hypothetical protein IKY80_04090 [Alistipes sp.]|nr:hypothetical protein [Alistipes sp.]
MQRLFYILLLPLLCALCSIVGSADECSTEMGAALLSQQVICDADDSVNCDGRVYTSDMLSSPSARCVVAEEVSSVVSHSSSARYRTSRVAKSKIMASAVSDRRAGHATLIFEYNHFTSSLRVAYYLYTLCRLRI